MKIRLSENYQISFRKSKKQKRKNSEKFSKICETVQSSSNSLSRNLTQPDVISAPTGAKNAVKYNLSNAPSYFQTKEESRSEIATINNYNFDLIRDFGMTRDRQNLSVVCPCCSNGTGDDGDGLRLLKATSRFPIERYYCDVCKKSFSRLDLYMIMQQRNLRSPSDIHKSLTELKAIINHSCGGVTPKLIIKPKKVTTEKQAQIVSDIQKAKARKYIKNCVAFDFVPESERRGISVEIANKYNLKYHRATNRYVFVFSDEEFKSRKNEAREKLKTGESKYIQNAGAQRYFSDVSIVNGGAQIVFFVEGTFDAISGYETRVEGVDFVSYEGRQIDRFCDFLKTHNFQSSGRKVVFCGDNDDAGKRFRETFKSYATAYNVETHFIDIPERYFVDATTGEKIIDAKTGKPKKVKDFNDYLQYNRAEFIQFISRIKDSIGAVENDVTPSVVTTLRDIPSTEVATPAGGTLHGVDEGNLLCLTAEVEVERSPQHVRNYTRRSDPFSYTGGRLD